MADGFSTGHAFIWNGTAIAAQLEAAIEQGMEETAAAAKAAAQSRAPVKTGRLRASIDARVERQASGRTVILEATAPYAGYVETGTSRSPAQPYIRPAADAEFPKLPGRVRAALRSIR